LGFPIRISPDHSLLAAPRSFSQLITSFIAYLRQGIHTHAGSSSDQRCDNPVARTTAPSHAGSLPRGVLLCDRIAGPLVPRSRQDVGLSTAPKRCLSVRRPPQPCDRGFILPRALRLLQSSAPASLPTGPRSPTSASHGVSIPHRGTSRRRPLLTGIPLPA